MSRDKYNNFFVKNIQHKITGFVTQIILKEVLLF